MIQGENQPIANTSDAAGLPAGLLEGATAGPASLTPRRAGYGLPCAKCRTYYSADLASCPVCKTSERVSPVVTAVIPPLVAAPEPVPDPAIVEQERERFLREFNSQLYASRVEVNATENFSCSLEHNHPEGFEPAAVCKACYERLRERMEVIEAALHIDAREATQVVYDAVWADASDPGKTYANAAQALLNELRRRAGISSVLGPMQRLSH